MLINEIQEVLISIFVDIVILVLFKLAFPDLIPSRTLSFRARFSRN
jgi:hypothetical protein